ncbi:hypothetical protein ACFOQM_18640 [Paenibacillus sp. GCM10012307]|uniref:Uncharacterized protein n=1 Tax=Paenibacillus roseus TaxID=2798579 RepID=A0A934J4P6_9BACL|nr:hypothetical protein [Paenibacillus roseus]MBJ6363239.1 hypothetical protein [Paenibacillus roseus]
MWKPLVLLLAVLSLEGCASFSFSLFRMTDASPAEPAFVIQDVYGRPSVTSDVYTRAGIVEPLPRQSFGRSSIEPYRPGGGLRTQP